MSQSLQGYNWAYKVKKYVLDAYWTEFPFQGYALYLLRVVVSYATIAEISILGKYCTIPVNNYADFYSSV